jgi:preprotein translocase subunit SecA
VRTFLDEEVEGIVAEHLTGEQVDDWDFDGLAKAVSALGLDGKDLGARGLAELGSRDEITERLNTAVDETLEAREKVYGPEVWAQVERFVLLRSIDTLWVEHLTELDDMRRGIGLRGYGGIDPLNEFKREAFKLYEELSDLIRRQVTNQIFHVTVQAAPVQQAAASTETSTAPVQATATTTSGNGSGSTTGAAASLLPGMAATARRGPIQYSSGDQPVAAAQPGAARGDARTKIGRNDPCWCGSGKKFKRCHGA